MATRCSEISVDEVRQPQSPQKEKKKRGRDRADHFMKNEAKKSTALPNASSRQPFFLLLDVHRRFVRAEAVEVQKVKSSREHVNTFAQAHVCSPVYSHQRGQEAYPSWSLFLMV